MVEKEYVSWNDAVNAAVSIVEVVEGLEKADQIDEIDRVVAVSRGGLPLGTMISHQLDVPLTTLEASHYDDEERKDSFMIQDSGLSEIQVSETVVLVDEVTDTGRTLEEITTLWNDYHGFDYITAVWHEKPESDFTPNIAVEETDKWIVYPWEEPREAIRNND